MQIAPEHWQTSNRVLMIRPKCFGFHAQASHSNAFMHKPSSDAAEIARKAQEEFDSLAEAVRGAGVEVLVYQEEQGLPDCVFPNNWVSCHQPVDGPAVLITYPMCDELRRAERSEEVLDLVAAALGEVGHIDLTALEDDGEILEGTGSLVLDRINGYAFACLSPRTRMRALEAWCDETGFQPVAFQALDSDRTEVYHTNVVMSIGTSVAVVCTESIVDASDQERVLELLGLDNRYVIEISLQQMNSFCGNILELQSKNGHSVFAMSSRAWGAFTAQQKRILQDAGTVVHVPIPTIEDVGGGSVRCMIAECGRG